MSTTTKIVGYDTETWSGNQISKGLEHYFADPNFQIICAGKAGANGISATDEGGEMHPNEYGLVHAAHNAHFDRCAVETFYGLRDSVLWFDTMVGVRAILGASAGRNTYMSLDRSAKLLLPKEFHKDTRGAELMEYFSYPSPKNDFGRISWQRMRDRYPGLWEDYLLYCGQDANAAYHLALLTQEYLGDVAFTRLVHEAEITYRMNRQGWPVDTEMLKVMAERAMENTSTSLDTLIAEYSPGWSTVKKNGDELFKPLNLNSGVQLKKWLAERGVTIANAQADTITETIDFVEDNLDLHPEWEEVMAVLQTKVDLGGATLKKLQPIANGISADGRLRHMYNHIAASSTHRTTGSGVQMQNLKRLPDTIEDLTEKFISTLNNGQLARNIRQLFKAPDDGEIIVADLKSIEGLLVGWVFGVDWMVEAVRDGKDMYTMAAVKRFGVPYVSVLPEQRRQSKTGILAGNYGGGKAAYVKASNGSLTEEQAAADVKAYRDTVPTLVQSWWDLNDMLVEAVEGGSSALRLYNGYSVRAWMLPDPLGKLEDPTLEVALQFKGKEIFSRLWHGVRIEPDEDGRKEITYAVADERKTAEEPWKRVNSEGVKFRLYGGKLTGTLIQSLARELYFFQLTDLKEFASGVTFQMIGQLHDEVVCEWKSGGLPLERIEQVIEESLTKVPWYLAGCPVRVKVSHAPRYIK